MYRCELCKELVPPNVPSYRVVTETRAVQYPRRPDANRVKVGRKTEVKADPGGAGHEIAHEAVACPRCAGKA
jgi:hypothetical protein